MYLTVNFEQLANELRAGERTVIFRKVDGTLREMRCTLQASVVPALQGSTRKQNDTVFTVFDVVAQDWRCFKRDRIIAIF